MNYFRTALLLAGLSGFFLVVGYLLGGRTGLVLALVVALGMNVFPATAHFYIANPLAAVGALSSLFSTHPPMEERIARLQAMTASGAGQKRSAPQAPTNPWGAPQPSRRGPLGLRLR